MVTRCDCEPASCPATLHIQDLIRRKDRVFRLRQRKLLTASRGIVRSQGRRLRKPALLAVMALSRHLVSRSPLGILLPTNQGRNTGLSGEGYSMKCTSILLAVLLAASAHAQNQISPAEAKDHVGENATVCGRVASTHTMLPRLPEIRRSSILREPIRTRFSRR
jgi:hypothetical protein